MDRRQMTAGPHLMRPNSFIPTSSSSGSHGGNNGKMGQIQIQQLALQSQLQSQGHPQQMLPTAINNGHQHQYQQHNQHQHNQHQHNQQQHNQHQHNQQQHNQHPAHLSNQHTVHQSNQHQQHPTIQSKPNPAHQNSQYQHQQPQHQFNGYYQTADAGTNHSQFSHGTMPRHLSVPETSSIPHPPPPPNTRTLRKTFSSHYGTLNNPQQPHQLSVVNGNPLYGNLMGGSNGGRHVATTNGRPHDPPPQQQQPLQIQPVINQIQQQHHSHKLLQHYPAGVVDGDGLPSTLVESMRTLFDILDDSKSGRVRLSDIESRWENNDAGGAPKGNTGAEPLIKMGVMGYLRKVTPPDGMLTFDRFCSGLRLALVTNNNPSSSSPLHNASTSYNNNNIPMQIVKNGGGNLYANNNPSAIASMQSQRPTSLPISTNHNVSQNGQNIQQQRTTSRIPGFSSSKLPMANGSGIPVSPKNKFASNLPPYSQPQNVAAMGTARRIPLTQAQQQNVTAEQGTTVALIHQPPPTAHPKQGGNAIPAFSHRPHDIQIGTIRLTKPSLVTPPNGGFTKFTRYSSKNGSLDNLKSDTEETDGKASNGKIRPPSAPLLDTTDDDDGGGEYAGNPRNSAKRDRARSRDRDMEDTKRGGTNPRSGKSREELSFGKRVVSFVTPRQRTLSMPQLQLSKLKSKSIQMGDEDSSPSASSSSHSPLSSGETKVGALKSSLKSSAGQGGSSIPTKMVKQKSDVTVLSSGVNGALLRNGQNGGLSFKDSNQESSNSEKEMPPPPPKPPRNNNGLTVMVGHNGSSSGTPDPPLSGSSTASVPSKPEIRQYLQSWKKGVAEKRPSPENNNAPPLPAQPPPNNPPKDAAATILTMPDSQNGNNETVKLRGDKKLNLRRRETARRHTVQAGIDFATLKRLKQLEQERDVLQQGMSVLESGKEWYGRQMEGVDEKISTLTKGAPLADQWNDSLEERLNVLSCRIAEINGLLEVLMDGSSSRIPHHMNLQIPSHLSMKTITRLKEQNRQLTQEVSDCSHRVTQLETEKAMLLRQLFHQKSNHHSEETVYM